MMIFMLKQRVIEKVIGAVIGSVFGAIALQSEPAQAFGLQLGGDETASEASYTNLISTAAGETSGIGSSLSGSTSITGGNYGSNQSYVGNLGLGEYDDKSLALYTTEQSTAGTDVTKPVPEPAEVGGSILGLGLLWFLRRKLVSSKSA